MQSRAKLSGAEIFKEFLLILNPSKCGSSWLAHGLTVQPYLLFPREFDFLFFLDEPPEKQWNTATAEDPENLRIRNDPSLSRHEKLTALYTRERSKYPGVTMLIDKAPSNVLRFDRYWPLFKESKIVLLYRDPRDIWVSLEFFRQRQLGVDERYDDIGNPSHLRESAALRMAMKNSQRVLDAENLLLHEGVPFCRITYEQLKQDYQGVLRAILEFIGFEIDENETVVASMDPEPRTLSEHLLHAEGFRPLFRKGVVGDWRNYLSTPEAKEIVQNQAGDLLIELGYESDAEW